ncbi:hypothetical protein Cri9333_0566 [Crinalium epipsammum PCC 9333]|uniref:Uncharacterized protein n=1 Tax=Crinalium epipsammum PCC 9333 TaxID=1173022 RepID=K9VU82_9CYAN|nr:hypothetical protein [Crinalium epipsammum]AFZ11516.1 hypothetical protein Cri9333_0566 [Crinalium epipsammum PCC 9333]
MNQNNNWRDRYADALDLGERPQQEYIEYDLFDQEPTGNQQIVWMPGEGPVPVYNPNSITSFPWESYLTNSWLMAGVVGILTTLLVTVLATTTNQKNQAVAPVDNTLANINQANYVLTQSRSAEVVAVTKYDYNPGEVTNPGLLQRAIFTSADGFKTRIQQLQASSNPATKDQPKEILVQRARVDVMKTIDMGASGRGAVMVREDPATGKTTYSQLDPAETVAVGLVRLLIIEASQRNNFQTFNLPEIAVAIRGHQGILRDAQANLLGAQGWVDVANQLRNYDLYGQKIIPNINSDSSTPTPPISSPKKEEGKKGTRGGGDKETK